jgi:DNA-binding response OmpR family regulator
MNQVIKKILVADDENLILYSLSSILHNNQTEVKTVKNGNEALREIGTHFYDLCFLDINLPDLNGMDIMKTIKEVSPATKIIIMTGGDPDDTTMRFIQENASLFISKPFDLDMVKGSVERILQGREPLHRNDVHAYRDYESFVKWLTNDKRRCERKFTAKAIAFSTDTLHTLDDRSLERVRLTAEVLDISDTGMGMLTTSALAPGNVITFSNIKEQTAGIVRWSMIADRSNLYRVGIQFIPPHEAAAQIRGPRGIPEAS